MKSTSASIWQRLKQQILPSTPDFYGMLSAQCQIVVDALDELRQYMEAGEDTHGRRVHELEHRGDQRKALSMYALHGAFSTPMDREDIYQAVATIDAILTYAKTTVREMTTLGLKPDVHTRAMAQLLLDGAIALQQGYAALEKNPISAEHHADAARQTERAVEKIYGAALVELFDAGHYLRARTGQQREDAQALKVLLAPMDADDNAAVSSAVGFVVEILKRREVYRHMSNAADRLVRAGEVLHDIVAKVA